MDGCYHMVHNTTANKIVENSFNSGLGLSICVLYVKVLCADSGTYQSGTQASTWHLGCGQGFMLLYTESGAGQLSLGHGLGLADRVWTWCQNTVYLVVRS